MKQHILTKEYRKAFIGGGGGQFASMFNMHELDQSFCFGSRRFSFSIYEVRLVASFDRGYIPKKAFTHSLVMIPNVTNSFGDWLACDKQAKLDYEHFMAIVSCTFTY